MTLNKTDNSVEFDLDSGVLCLDFANTVDWHASETPEDRLKDALTLFTWGEAAGVLPAAAGARLRQLAGQKQREAAAAYRRAIKLREAIYRIFAGLADAKEPDPAELAALNQALSVSLGHLRVEPAPAGFDYVWEPENESLDQVYWAVARSAAELLTSDRLQRVSQCADDRGCGYLFLDTSRNRSRRWCSMESCGNRAKARRHYRRSTQAA